MNRCLTSQELRQLLDGELDASLRADVESHLETCGTCQAAMEQLVDSEWQSSVVPAIDKLENSANVSSRDSLNEIAVGRFKSRLRSLGEDDQLGHALPLEPTMPPQPPAVFGQYRVMRQLGRGGMGVVYLVEDLELKRLVALKVMSSNAAQNEPSRMRFLREARSMAAIKHPNVVTIYHVGQQQDVPFLVMEFLAGESLEQRLRRQPPLNLSEIIHIGIGVATGLAAAHDLGLIHRDVKPGNVFLESPSPVHGGAISQETLAAELISTDKISVTQCRIKLLDFGLARARDSMTLDSGAGVMMGTAGYLAPEQARGGNVDHRADLFGLGCVLYRMLTGTGPFDAPNVMASLMALESVTPPSPLSVNPTLPDALSELVMRLLSKSPIDRLSSARDVATRLQSIAANAEAVRVDLSNSIAPVQAGTKERIDSTATRRRRDAEARRLTLTLFNFEAKVAGSDERLDADQQLEMSVAFADWTKGCLQEFGGTIVPTSGDIVTACFGFPRSYEDSPQRAVHAAVRLIDSLPDWSQRIAKQLGCEVTVWALVHSGEVVAAENEDGNRSFVSIAGDATNVLSRLESFAHPGVVTITDSTWRLTHLFFETEELGQQTVRGVSAPIMLHRVLRAVPIRSRVELLDPGNLTPLIGRDTELSVLMDRWEQALEGLGQIVLLIGDAGLGKSRLIREMREHITLQSAAGTPAATADSEPVVIEFRCSQHHQGTSFFPATEYLARLLNFEQQAGARERIGEIERYLAKNGLGTAENVALLAALLAVSSDGLITKLEIGAQRQKELTLALLRQWLKELSTRQPVLLIVEDLHWVDPTTLELLGAHVEDFEAGRLLSIFTFRPEFQTPWRSFSHQTQIALNRLTKRQVGELIKRRAQRQDIPDLIVQQIVSRTDGVPLFVEEFTNMMMESGTFDTDSVDQSMTRLQRVIPATLQDLLIARLDRMDANFEVVQLAATIGREFSYRLLAAASELSADTLQVELLKLVGAEMLYQKGTYPEARFIFKHALIQDAAFGSLLKKRKLHLHHRVAAALAEQFPEVCETEPELLAHHFTEAGDIEPAIHWWQRAGQRAQKIGANHEAIAHYRRGLNVVAQMPECPQRDGAELGLTVPMGICMLAAKGYANPEAGPVFDRARELGERVAPPPVLFYILWGLWAWRLVRSDLLHCRDLQTRIVELAQSLSTGTSDPSWICESHFVSAVTHFYGGEFAAAREHAEAGIALFNPAACQQHCQHTGQDVRSGMLVYAALSNWALGHVDRGVAQAREAVAVSRTLGHPMSLAFAMTHAVWVLSYARLWPEALALATEAEKLGAEQSLALWLAMAKAEQGVCHIHLGRLDSGLSQLATGSEAFEQTGGRNVPPMWLVDLADGHRRAGQLMEARQWLDRAVKFVRDHGGLHHLSEMSRVQGDVELAVDPQSIAVAEDYYEQAIAAARERQAKSWELRGTMSLARLWKSSDKRSAGRERLAECLSWFEPSTESLDVRDARALLDEL